MRKKNDHSIENEPHLQGKAARHDPSEHKAGRTLGQHPDTPDELMRTGQSVYDEPSIFRTTPGAVIDQDWSCSQCGYNLRGLVAGHRCPECGHVELYHPAPDGAASYRTWLTNRVSRTSLTTGWFVALVAALIGGPMSVVATFLDPHGKGTVIGGWWLTICVIGPIVEEVMKIAAAGYVVEQKPYLFGRREQILAAAAGSALIFAAIENLLYLNVAITNPSIGMILWRWTVCVVLHVGCSLTAARGLVQVWDQSMRELRKPRIAGGLPTLITAIVIHGTYNTLVMLFET